MQPSSGPRASLVSWDHHSVFSFRQRRLEPPADDVPAPASPGRASAWSGRSTSQARSELKIDREEKLPIPSSLTVGIVLIAARC
jgi:hypothetical protein